MSLPRDETSSLAPSSREEADTRMFLHTADAIQSSFTKIIVHSVDTDVLVLAEALVQKLQALASESIQLWVAFGTGEHLRYLAAHEIANTFTNNAALALPAFHTFAGCNTVSCFYGKNKKTPLDAWKSFPEVTPVFIALSRAQTEIAEGWLSPPECFAVLLYERTSRSSSVNDTRKQLFTRKARNFDTHPPTQDSLPNMSSVLHTRLATSGEKPSCQTHLFLAHKIGDGYRKVASGGLLDNTVRNHKVMPRASKVRL